jgi:hypothetical protein
MKEISSLSVTQFRIFPHDAIPFSLLRSAYGTVRLKTFMGFRTAAFDPESGDLVFEDGAYKKDDSPLLAIPTIAFNSRRIVLSVAGSSDHARLAYGALRDFFSLLGFTLPEPILFTEETNCIAQLDFDWTELINPALFSTVTDFAQHITLPPQIKTGGIRFTLEFSPNQTLKDAGVTLSDKQIVIEPRLGLLLSQRIYFTGSPSSSDEHIALLRTLEARVASRAELLKQLEARLARKRR